MPFPGADLRRSDGERVSGIAARACARISDVPVQLQPTHMPVPGADLRRFDDERISSVAARAYARIAAAWKLSNPVAAGLLGVSPRTWGRIKSDNWNGVLDQDRLMRVSAVTGLYKALHLYFSRSIADRWVSLPNTGRSFAGHKPIDLMLDGGLPTIMQVRDYVDALRGGV